MAQPRMSSESVSTLSLRSQMHVTFMEKHLHLWVPQLSRGHIHHPKGCVCWGICGEDTAQRMGGCWLLCQPDVPCGNKPEKCLNLELSKRRLFLLECLGFYSLSPRFLFQKLYILWVFLNILKINKMMSF